MKFWFFVIFAIVLTTVKVSHSKPLTYEEARNAVIEAEETIMVGGRILLSPKEHDANKILMKFKNAEMDIGFNDPSVYAPGMHFFHAKELIEKSSVFKFIQKMPKGSLLHGHNTAMASSEWVIKNATYRPNALKCVNNRGIVIFTFHQDPEYNCTTYVNIVEERSRAADKDAYDKELEKAINLYTPTPEIEYSHISIVWKKFQNMFETVGDLIRYLPVFRDYHWQVLEEMYEDGLMYIEFRTSFTPLYDDNNREYTQLDVIQEFKDIINKFKATHPNFLGAKAIYSTGRRTLTQTIQTRINNFREMFLKHPDFVVGFDLVGQEDLGKPLYDFIAELKTLPSGAQFFFHAGETNWYGASTDLNILDAVLLNTTRIGHGYALTKHPVLWNAVKNRGIAIEVNPISNQVLHLVWDLRNHPASFFISENIPMVVSNDDPGFWNAKGLSYDFYYAFMACAPNDAGINTLKQLVWNSIKYSALTEAERIKAAKMFVVMWDEFLDDVLSGKVI